jgi:hypothetical protein
MDDVVCRFRNPTQGHGTHRARLAAMKPSGYAARPGRNGKRVEWSSKLDPSNSENRYTGGGTGFSSEGRNNQLVLAPKTCESLSSLSDQNLHYGRMCIAGGGCDKKPCIHYLSDRHNTSRYSFCSISRDSESRFRTYLGDISGMRPDKGLVCPS